VKALVAVSMLLGLGLAACNQDGAASEARPKARPSASDEASSNARNTSPPPVASAHALPAASEPVLNAPIYDLELEITDQHGESIRFDVFRDHPVILSMFYATCPYACPTLISDIKRIDQKLSAAERSQVRVLLVTFDPDRDTPEKLAELAKTHAVDTKRWKFARASKEATRDLAAVLGLKYRQLPSGQFNHSSVITVVDGKGMIRARTEGLESENQQLVAKLHELTGPVR